ncbi:replication initiator protein A [Staphylococcus pseudintermedius]|nr:replication initiator protein A [Staphylococcus pseudintermedius]MDF0323216.1 replication initiator protein A [Staphylococcus pseudintermedius]MDF0327761.1 replication initiator protein A [Staphylococcus pseudintermedius]MDF0336754.1 replication initiator protein A [Staphylococcus pseudintermedius]MDF0340982.1 replication initiator protein A [Staphylococcus pseudintermedius]
MSNQFFTIQENYRERFFQLPKVFFTNPKYIKLKNVSKVAYAILQDRLQLSIKNKWIDEDGRIYFIYTDQKLMDILNISKNHVTTVKKELKEAGLLIQKRQGLNKPNISYLLKPEITSDDIYQIETQENDLESSHDKESHTEGIRNHTQRESGITHRGNLESHTEGTNDTDFSDTDFSDTDINDMNDMNDDRKQFKQNIQKALKEHSNQDENDIEYKNYILQSFPEQTKSYLTNFTTKDIKIIKEVILKAKESYNTKHCMEYMLEDIDKELLKVLKRFKAVLTKKHEKVERMQGYLMTSIIRELESITFFNNLQNNSPINNAEYKTINVHENLLTADISNTLHANKNWGYEDEMGKPY